MRFFQNKIAIQTLLILACMFLPRSMQSDDISIKFSHNGGSGPEIHQSQVTVPSSAAKKLSGRTKVVTASEERNPLDSLKIPKGGGIQIVAVIGTYQQPAVIRFQVLDDNTIRGGYFYLKHKKILELMGRVNGEFFDLTESFEGKVTGHMRINPLKPKESEWLDPSRECSGSLVVEHMETLSAEEYSKQVKVRNHDLDHPIGIYNGLVFEKADVTDDVDVLHLDDGKKMFLNIHVVASNAHMGSFAGLLDKIGSISYEHRSPDCRINASLMDDGSLSIDEDCRSCCGARATLSGSFPLKEVEEYHTSKK
jgi:hypothetical protein